jgi:hypothetical protein
LAEPLLKSTCYGRQEELPLLRPERPQADCAREAVGERDYGFRCTGTPTMSPICPFYRWQRQKKVQHAN